jgi:outer membrane biosynthesis protein TonB
MNADRILSTARAVVTSLSLAIVLAGCKSATPAATDDAALNMQVQAKLFADQNLSGQSIQTSVQNGIVTLNGSVTSDSARTIASGDVAQIAGIKTVVNNLVVQSAPSTTTNAAAAPPPPMPFPAPASKQSKPSAVVHQPPYQPAQAPIERNAPAPQPQPQPQPQQQPQQQAQVQPPPPPPPPPAPVVHNITLPAGTSIPIRITQTLDSATTQTGDKFTGAIASDIIVEGMVVLPQGTPVTGRVDDAQDAAHFKGSSLLTISLSAIDRHGERIQVATEPYSKQGEGRGKNTAEKVGGGAAVGAILGGIFGGGKGAAIGAAAGGGVGAGANGVTRGQQVQIPSESVVRFKLSDPIIVHVNSGGSNSSGDSPTLERRSDQQ